MARYNLDIPEELADQFHARVKGLGTTKTKVMHSMVALWCDLPKEVAYRLLCDSPSEPLAQLVELMREREMAEEEEKLTPEQRQFLQRAYAETMSKLSKMKKKRE